jgi:hypothetical protein
LATSTTEEIVAARNPNDTASWTTERSRSFAATLQLQSDRGHLTQPIAILRLATVTISVIGSSGEGSKPSCR